MLIQINTGSVNRTKKTKVEIAIFSRIGKAKTRSVRTKEGKNECQMVVRSSGSTARKSLLDQTSKSKTLDYANTHRDIIEKCKKGNRQAQFELYRLYSKAMYNVCLRMLANEQDAEDLLQNSFVDVFTKLHSFRYKSSVGAWIKRIVINNCINYLKKNRLLIEELEDKHAETMPEVDRVSLDGPQLNVDKIKSAMQRLPEGYRLVFSLYMFEGYDHREISGILEISEATSKSQKTLFCLNI